MNTDGTTEQIVDEMKNYGIDILGISESRWTGTGKVRLEGGEILVYSGVETRHESGIGIIIYKKNMNTLLWHPVNEIIITARLYSKHIKMTVVQCYAPTNDASDVDKENFYEVFHGITTAVQKHDMFVVLGDKYDGNKRMWRDEFKWILICRVLSNTESCNRWQYISAQGHPFVNVDVTKWSYQDPN